MRNWLSKNSVDRILFNTDENSKTPVSDLLELFGNTSIPTSYAPNWINNTMLLSQSSIGNKLYFHDFEYAGWDDPYKLIVDILIQPENILSKYNSMKIINSLESCLKIKDYFDYLKVYLILYRAKWVSIIFKKILQQKLSPREEETLLKKSSNYFTKVGTIWDL